jgi:enoyl-CoA hydratase
VKVRESGLRIEERGAVRIVTLDRAVALNAIDAALHRRIVEVWSELDADPEARAVVLTGAGSAFSAGGDLDLLRRLHDASPTSACRSWRR